jgi:hypothetical protein
MDFSGALLNASVPRVGGVCPFIVTISSAVQPLNAYFMIFSNDSGRTMLVSAVQAMNAELPILARFCENETIERDVHP